jgi:hypothetical protein
MGHKAEESKTLFRWPFPLLTKTDLMPNPVAGDSERAAGKSKKQNGFLKPKSEPPPNRISEIATGDSALSTAGVIADGFPECRIRM